MRRVSQVELLSHSPSATAWSMALLFHKSALLRTQRGDGSWQTLVRSMSSKTLVAPGQGKAMPMF